jgi:hypothetical protein
MVNVYSTMPVLQGARSERDLRDIAIYGNFAMSQDTGPMGNSQGVPQNVCNCPYGYRTLSNAYQISAGPHNMTSIGQQPLNLQYYGPRPGDKGYSKDGKDR